jgi:hypothetical protein
MRRHRPPILTTVVAAAALSLLAAGCGSKSPSSSSASSSAGRPTQAQVQQVVRFADCMRSHGVPNFPDPTTSPREFKQAFDTKSPALQSAATACQHLLPNGGQSSPSAAQSQAQTAALLAFAGCMRAHRFPSFPDPTSSGQLTHQMLANAGISLHQPAVLQAADACTSVTHGVVTKAVVARFVAGQ